MVFIFSPLTSSMHSHDFNAHFIVSTDESCEILSEGLLIPFLIKFSLSPDNKIPFCEPHPFFCV